MNEANAAASLKYTKIPAGKELVKEWNELYPQWAYSDGNAKNFLRDFNSTRKKLARHPRMRKWRGRFLKMISDGQ